MFKIVLEKVIFTNLGSQRYTRAKLFVYLEHRPIKKKSLRSF